MHGLNLSASNLTDHIVLRLPYHLPYQFTTRCYHIYPLVNIQKAMERSTMLSMGKSTISMAMFNSYVTNYHIYLNNMAFKKTSNMTSDSQDLCLQPSCQWIVHPQQPKRSKDARDGHDLSSSYRPHHRPHHVSAVDVIGRSSQCHAKERMAACIYIYVIYMEYTIIYMYTIFYII